jgi:hypothetical protein
VAEHLGKLIFTLEPSEQAEVDVDIPIRQREGVRVGVHHHVEAERRRDVRRLGHEARPHLLHVRGEGRIGVDEAAPLQPFDFVRARRPQLLLGRAQPGGERDGRRGGAAGAAPGDEREQQQYGETEGQST